MIPPTQANIAEAARAIRAGGLVAFPTETVYGLGADATDGHAVARIFAAKGRPAFNPLIVHVADRDAASRLVAFDKRADRLAAAFWPGPLSLVLPRLGDCPVSLLVSAGLDTIAVRVPDHEIAQALLAEAGRPIAAPSANRAGEVSPTAADHVAQSLGAQAGLILDGGPAPLGLESTVLDLTGAAPLILRPGFVTAEQLAAVVGPLAAADSATEDEPHDDTGPKSPGMAGRHYATRTPLRLEAETARAGEALLSFGPTRARANTPDAIKEFNLSPAGDLIEAAANLFAMMREADQVGCSAIAVVPIPEYGLGIAINDRLRRAATAERPNQQPH